MVYISKIKIKSSRSDVKSFLNEVCEIIDEEDFNIEKNFMQIRSRKSDSKYSTPNTMLDLGYDAEDVVGVIKHLELKNYSETLIDKDDNNPPLLFVFGKDINSQTIYIKVKIKKKEEKYILCLSFHYAMHEMTYPYA